MNFEMFITGFLPVAIPYMAALMSPGPDTAMILRNSLMYSKRSGLLAALGITTGMVMHATYSICGLGLIIHESLLAFNIIRGVGAFYLIYIGWKSFQSARPMESTKKIHHAKKDLTPFQAYKTGFLSNSLNPMVIVFFVTILSSVMDFSTPPYILAIYVFLMAVLTFIWFGAVALFLTLPKVQRQFQKLGPWVGRITGGVLILFGCKALYLLIQAFR